MFIGFVVAAIELFFPQYQASIPLLFSLLILGLAIPFGSLLSVSTQAKGNTQLEFQWNLISAFISILVVACLAYSNDLIVFGFGMGILQILITTAGFVFYSKVHTSLPKKVYFSTLFSVVLIYSLINTLFYLFIF
jgi:exopolysaccharide (amylovoran) exporter